MDRFEVNPMELVDKFKPTELVGQFVVAQSIPVQPPGWSTKPLGSWQIAHDPRLPVHDVRGGDGAVVGIVVGFAIDDTPALIQGAVELATATPDVESWVAGLAGRFLVVELREGDLRFHSDAVGSLGTVYCPSQKIVASTGYLIPYTPETQDRAALIDELRAAGSRFLFPFGTTSREGIYRLLGNHRLDTHNWQPRRMWPTGPVDRAEDSRELLSEIGREVRRVVTGVAAAYPLSVSLTGGKDSRALLAVTKDIAKDVDFYTLSVGDRQADIDVFLARTLAQRYGLRHNVIRTATASNDEQLRWLYRTGCVASEDRGREITNAYYQLDPARAELTADFGEIMRDFATKPGMDPRAVETILYPMKLKPIPWVLETLDRYIKSLPLDDPYHIMDMKYLDGRIASWAGVLPYAEADSVPLRMSVFTSRRLIQLAMALPLDLRLADGAPEEVTRMLWPELLNLPFNRYTGMTHVKDRLKKRVYRMKKAMRR